MTTVSTHDSETLQLWWQEFPEDAKAFAAFKNWTYSPDLTQAQRLEMLSDAHHTPSLFHINLLQEYLALFPELVWPNPADERINIPGKILPTNWTYRFRLSVEEIISHVKLKQAIKQIISYDSPL
jgi:4-alpha-glucanotransferase